MKRLIMVACFLATPAFAQQQPDPLVQSLTDDWLLMQGGIKHTAQNIDAIVKDYQAAKAERDSLKIENEKLKKLLDDKTKAEPPK